MNRLKETHPSPSSTQNPASRRPPTLHFPKLECGTILMLVVLVTILGTMGTMSRHELDRCSKELFAWWCEWRQELPQGKAPRVGSRLLSSGKLEPIRRNFCWITKFWALSRRHARKLLRDFMLRSSLGTSGFYAHCILTCVQMTFGRPGASSWLRALSYF